MTVIGKGGFGKVRQIDMIHIMSDDILLGMESGE